MLRYQKTALWLLQDILLCHSDCLWKPKPLKIHQRVEMCAQQQKAEKQFVSLYLTSRYSHIYTIAWLSLVAVRRSTTTQWR